MSHQGPSARSHLKLFQRFLRDEGLPLTSQREAVAETLFSAEGHWSVEDLEEALRRRDEKIGKATIYRTLDLLVKSRLVEELDFGEGFKRYEHRLSRMIGHAHLVCDGCGTVEEYQIRELPAIEARVARETKFRPTRHRLQLHGLCTACQESGVTLPQQGLLCPIEVA
ncbi:MAG: Fur family transcriptional regulator [Longimicrobiales bacterium]|nr:Fur family transcriptional regulator [Longimicrobiales bacterium]